MENWYTINPEFELKRIQLLPQPARTVLLHHFGLGDNDKLSIKDISLKLGLSRYHIETIIMEFLRGDNLG